MRVAIVTDIHSNLPALEAVLEAADKAEVEQIWCLGDLVGYGAHPDSCTRIVQERCEISLAGNHDLAALGELDISTFSRVARSATEWTKQNVSAGTVEFLRSLDPAAEREGIGLYHASPRDPVWEYVLSIEQAEDCMEIQSQRVSLIGHSHVSLFFERREREENGGRVRGELAPAGRKHDLQSGTWMINPGSVGQPRDGDPKAAWLELDTDAWTATHHRVEYDIDRAAEAIVEAGLPDQLALRLYHGQ